MPRKKADIYGRRLPDRIRAAEAADHHELGANADNFAAMNEGRRRMAAALATIAAGIALIAALIFLAHIGPATLHVIQAETAS